MYPVAILTNYPLSKEFRNRIASHLGSDPTFVNISDLRRISLMRLLSGLLSVRAAKVLVAVEDESTHALTPVLQLLAAFIRARRFGTIDYKLTEIPFSRVTSVRSAISVLAESLKAAGALLLATVAIRRLLRLPRAHFVVDEYRRVAYLNCNFYIGIKAGGSVGHISGVANSLMDLGYSLAFCSVTGRLLVDDRAQYVPLAPPRMFAIPVEATYYLYDRSLDSKLMDALRSAPPDFIYQRMSVGNFTGVRLARRLGVPLVVEYNGSEAWCAANWGRPLRFHSLAVSTEAVCLHHADVVVTVSDVLGDELVRLGIERERVLVYPNCIDPKMFDPSRFSPQDRERLRRELGFGKDDVLATFIGTFGPWHGVEVLADAIRQMVTEQSQFLDNAKLRFVLIGDGSKMPLVQAKLAETNMQRYVRLTGLVPQADAPSYLAASDILLSPHVPNPDGSAFFGSPTKLFEYMAMGKAIVASDLDQIGQVLRPALEVNVSSAPDSSTVTNELAVLVPPGDVSSLIAGIKYCCGNARLRDKLGDNARAAALRKFTWRHHTEAIIGRLKEVRPPRSMAGTR